MDAVHTIGPRTFDFSREVAVMAIVNRTRDSFHDGGATFALDAAVGAAERAVAAGADWVDVGAVPFSPLVAPVGAAEETDRLLPVVAAVRARTDAVISVDTTRAAVARAALAAGADVVNDTSGLADPAMAGVVAAAGAHVVVTHSLPRPAPTRPAYGDVVAEVRAFLAARAAVAAAAGVPRDHVIVDPGHDLNKNTRHSLELTRRLGELADLGHPLLVAVSNKDFLQEATGHPARSAALLPATVAAVVLSVVAGARIVRVHDVAAARTALDVVGAVLGRHAPRGPLRHNA